MQNDIIIETLEWGLFKTVALLPLQDKNRDHNILSLRYFHYQNLMMAYNSTSCALSDDEVSVSDTTNYISESTVIRHESRDSEITFSERLKICCKPKYQPRKLKNKGAILVLVWSSLVMTVFFYVQAKSFEDYSNCSKYNWLIPIPGGLVMLFAGWLADVYFERYKVLRWSIIIMWISSLLLTTTFVIEKIVTFTNYYQLVFLASLGVGYSMFQANIIQFGIDQLTDASTDEIVSFINWYAWSFTSSATIINFAYQCTSPQYSFIAPLMLCVALSVVASSLFLCNKILIKEPVTKNPFILIYQVLKYALNHKYARQRSAFTYCEDELPSRLDFGKSKYGGPFTTEQVEDVKTFFRALGFVLYVSFTYGMIDEFFFREHLLNKTIIQVNTYPIKKCSFTFIFKNMYYIASTLLIPFNEIFIHPSFQRCLPSISSHRKIVIGLILQIIFHILMVIFVTLSRQHYLINNKFTNNTLPCVFDNDSNITYDFKFYAISDVISSASSIMIFVGVMEFLCAQIPYSMKGVIVGLFYCVFGIFFLFGQGTIIIIFKATSSSWSDDALFGCEFWYLQIKLILILISGLTLLLLSIIYKRRKREDVLPNEHIFAERYYSKKLQQVN